MADTSGIGSRNTQTGGSLEMGRSPDVLTPAERFQRINELVAKKRAAQSAEAFKSTRGSDYGNSIRDSLAASSGMDKGPLTRAIDIMLGGEAGPVFGEVGRLGDLGIQGGAKALAAVGDNARQLGFDYGLADAPPTATNQGAESLHAQGLGEKVAEGIGSAIPTILPYVAGGALTGGLGVASTAGRVIQGGLGMALGGAVGSPEGRELGGAAKNFAFGGAMVPAQIAGAAVGANAIARGVPAWRAALMEKTITAGGAALPPAVIEAASGASTQDAAASAVVNALMAVQGSPGTNEAVRSRGVEQGRLFQRGEPAVMEDPRGELPVVHVTVLNDEPGRVTLVNDSGKKITLAGKRADDVRLSLTRPTESSNIVLPEAPTPGPELIAAQAEVHKATEQTVQTQGVLQSTEGQAISQAALKEAMKRHDEAQSNLEKSSATLADHLQSHEDDTVKWAADQAKAMRAEADARAKVREEAAKETEATPKAESAPEPTINTADTQRMEAVPQPVIDDQALHEKFRDRASIEPQLVQAFDRPAPGEAARTKRTPGKPIRAEYPAPTEATFPSGETLRPAGLFEGVRLIKSLFGDVPTVKRLARGAQGRFSIHPNGKMNLEVAPDVAANKGLDVRTVLHEGMHMADAVTGKPDAEGKPTLARGGIGARILGELNTAQRYITGDSARHDIQPIKQELAKLAEVQAPWEKGVDPEYDAYRNSSSELYARGMSEMLADPGRVQREAPAFFAAVADTLSSRPAFKTAYDAMQKLLAGGSKANVEAVRGEIKRMFERGDEESKRIEEESRAEQEDANRFSTGMKTAIHSTKAPVYDYLRQALGGKDRWAKTTDPRFIEARNRIEEASSAGISQEDFAEVERDVEKPLAEAGVDWHDLGENLLAHDAMSMGADKFNPAGITAKDAVGVLAKTEAELGPERSAKLTEAANALRGEHERAIDRFAESGMVDSETATAWKENKDYAPHMVIDFMERNGDILKGEREGSFRDIRNPATQLVLMDDSMSRAARRNDAKKTLATALRDTGKVEWKKAAPTFPGEDGQLIAPGDPFGPNKPGHSWLDFRDNGDRFAVEVPNYVAEAMSPADELWAKSLSTFIKWGTLNPLSRGLFTTHNPAFQFFTQPMRDIPETIKALLTTYGRQNSDAKWWNAYTPYVRGGYKVAKEMGLAGRYIKGEKLTAYEQTRLRDLVDRGLIRRQGNNQYQREAEDPREAFKIRSGAIDASPESRMRKIEKGFVGSAIGKRLLYISEFGERIHVAQKLFAEKTLRELGVTREEATDYMKRFVGNPYTQERGKAQGVLNEVFLYSNVVQKSYARALDMMQRHPARFAREYAIWNAPKKALMAAAAAGLIGPTLKKFYAHWSEEDKDKNTIIPIPPFFVKDKNGIERAVGIKLPDDDASKLFGLAHLTYRSLYQAASAVTGNKTPTSRMTGRDLVKIGASELPGLSPGIKAANAGAEYAQGINPTDTFRGRPVLSDDEMAAGGTRAHLRIAKWMSDQMGIGRFIPSPDSQGHYSAPSLGWGSVVKLTDTGDYENNKATVQKAETEAAAKRLPVHDELLQAKRDKDKAAIDRMLRQKKITPQVAAGAKADMKLTPAQISAKHAKVPAKDKAALGYRPTKGF